MATVSTNVLVRDLNTHTAQHDERRIEVIANGLPLWNGSQLAVDTTLVFPLPAAGHPRRHQRQTAGAALRLARQAKSRTYPELTGSGRARLVVLGMEQGGVGVQRQSPSYGSWPNTRLPQTLPPFVMLRPWPGLPAGQHSWPLLPCGHLRAVCSCCPPRPPRMWTVRPPLSVMV